jgi:hypothetical protein
VKPVKFGFVTRDEVQRAITGKVRFCFVKEADGVLHA